MLDMNAYRSAAPDLDPNRRDARPSGNSFIRAVAAAAMAVATKSYAGDLLKQHHPHDAPAALVLKAATSPASMSDADWAGALVGTGAVDFLGALGPASAGAALLLRGASFRFDGAGAILVSSLLASAANASFVGEGEPIPHRQFSLDGALLSPRKIAALTSFTRETFRHSLPNIEVLVGAVLADSVGLAFDTALLSAAADDGTTPAGLRDGVAALVASADADLETAMRTDIKTLAAAVAGVAGNAPIIFVASPVQALALRLWGGTNLSFEVFSSAALPAGTVVAIASNALVSAVDPSPRFETTDKATIVMRDDAGPVGVAGSPNVVAAPVRSLWQSDTIGVKVIFEVSFGLRSSAGIAWIEDALW